MGRERKEGKYVYWTEPQVVKTNREAKIDKAKSEKLISARQEYYSNGWLQLVYAAAAPLCM